MNGIRELFFKATEISSFAKEEWRINTRNIKRRSSNHANIEKIFYEDSYTYRSNKSALQPIAITRQRCWRKGWTLEFEIKGPFDNINHEVVMKMVKPHTNDDGIVLYIQRWLVASFPYGGGTNS